MSSLNYDFKEKLKNLNVFEKIMAVNVLVFFTGWLMQVIRRIPRHHTLSWFELPEIETKKQAPRYKMGFILTAVLYVLSFSLNVLLRPILEKTPWQLNILIILIINVLLMTYVVMPKVTYWLRDWLYK